MFFVAAAQHGQQLQPEIKIGAGSGPQAKRDDADRLPLQSVLMPPGDVQAKENVDLEQFFFPNVGHIDQIIEQLAVFRLAFQRSQSIVDPSQQLKGLGQPLQAELKSAVLLADLFR